MPTKFNCPHCSAAVESDTNQAGLEGDCPACGKILTVPIQQEKIPVVRKKSASEVATDLAADAVCGVAKTAWKAAKFAVPVVAKVLVRAGEAAAPVVKDLLSGPVKPPSPAVTYAGVRAIIRAVFGG